MTLKENLHEMMIRRGFPDMKSFLDDILITQKKTYSSFRDMIKGECDYHCSVIHVQQTCLKVTRKCPGVVRIKRDLHKGGFYYEEQEVYWNKTAQRLGYNDLSDLFREWDQTEFELAEAFGVSKNAVYRRRQIMGIKRKRRT